MLLFYYNFRLLCNFKQLQNQKIIKAFYGMNIQDLYSGKKQMTKNKIVDYATKEEHENLQRFQKSEDEFSGVKPTKVQRRLLVLTRFYPNHKSIPEYVPYRQICKMGDRLRIFYISFGVIFLFVIFFSFETQLYKKILRDREVLLNEKKD